MTREVSGSDARGSSRMELSLLTQNEVVMAWSNRGVVSENVSEVRSRSGFPSVYFCIFISAFSIFRFPVYR